MTRVTVKFALMTALALGLLAPHAAAEASAALPAADASIQTAKGPAAAGASSAGASAARSARSARSARTRQARRQQARIRAAAKRLIGRYFWTYEDYQWNRSADPIGLVIVNARFAYFGIPKAGVPGCAKPGPVYEDGELVSGCVRYAYNPRNGAIRVGNLRGTFRRNTLKLGETTYYNATVPEPGTRLRASLISRGFYGACGLIVGCTTWTENLILDRKGNFARSRSTLTTTGPGAPVFVAVGNYPPDEHGLYRILNRGRIFFRYADGKTSIETIAIDHNDAGRPDPVNEGLLLDNVHFYPDTDD